MFDAITSQLFELYLKTDINLVAYDLQRVQLYENLSEHTKFGKDIEDDEDLNKTFY